MTPSIWLDKTGTFGPETNRRFSERRGSSHNGIDSKFWDLESNVTSIAGLGINRVVGSGLWRSRPMDSARN